MGNRSMVSDANPQVGSVSYLTYLSGCQSKAIYLIQKFMDVGVRINIERHCLATSSHQALRIDSLGSCSRGRNIILDLLE